MASSLIPLDNGNTFVTIVGEVARPGYLLPVAKQYEDADGRCLFEEWFVDLHPPAAAKVTAAIIRMEQGNFSNVKAVGPGVFEYKIDFGPGYRIYFGKIASSSFWAVERRRSSSGISTLQPHDGTTTNEEKDKEQSKWL